MAEEAGVNDGYVNFDAGQNEGSIPALIGDNQTQRNINVTLRNRVVRPRPSYVDFELKFFSKDIGNKSPALGALSYENNFYFGRRQHSGKFQTPQGEFLIQVINGIIYAVDLNNLKIKVVEVTGSQKILNYNLTRLNGNQSENEYVIYDWPGNPIEITSEFVATRSKKALFGIPRSYIGTHVHGRLFVGNNGIEFGASDSRSQNSIGPITFRESITGPGNPSPPYPDQFFKLDFIDKLSSITAMGFLHQPDGTSPLGFGPLFISTKEAIHLAAVNQPRAQWQQTQSFVRVVVYNYGIVGPRAFTNVGQDLFYKSFDGHIYSISLISSDDQKWGVSHISNEIKQSLISRNQHLLKYSSLCYFKNRLFVTLKPFIIETLSLFGKPVEDYVSNGLGILEINNITGISGNSPPVWAGIYTGTFQDMLEVGNKLIILGKTGIRNSISQLSEFRTLDYSRGIIKKIRSRVYTKEFSFKAPLNDKKITSVQLDIRNILGPFIAHVYYRTKEEKEWQTFGSIYYTPPDLLKRGSISEEYICPQKDAVTLCKNIQFRIDMIGEDWELLKFVALGEAIVQIQYSRKFDKPFKLTEEFKDVDDLDV